MDDCLVKLDIFEGPLDLLLYLIKESEIDIYDIPVAAVTRQYIDYLNLMEKLNLEVAGEFLVMAATLAHIKSKMLLPGEPDDEGQPEEGSDPREGLVRQLLEYRKYKEAVVRLKEFEVVSSEVYPRSVAPENGDSEPSFFEPSLFDLIAALREMLKEKGGLAEAEGLSVDEVRVADKKNLILDVLSKKGWATFGALFDEGSSLSDIVVTFLALLELVKARVVVVRQQYRFGPLTIAKAVAPAAI